MGEWAAPRRNMCVCRSVDGRPKKVPSKTSPLARSFGPLKEVLLMVASFIQAGRVSIHSFLPLTWNLGEPHFRWNAILVPCRAILPCPTHRNRFACAHLQRPAEAQRPHAPEGQGFPPGALDAPPGERVTPVVHRLSVSLGSRPESVGNLCVAG